MKVDVHPWLVESDAGEDRWETHVGAEGEPEAHHPDLSTLYTRTRDQRSTGVTVTRGPPFNSETHMLVVFSADARELLPG